MRLLLIPILALPLALFSGCGDHRDDCGTGACKDHGAKKAACSMCTDGKPCAKCAAAAKPACSVCADGKPCAKCPAPSATAAPAK